jgi:hypothetical protein
MTDETDVELAADERVDLIGRRHVAQVELDLRMCPAEPLDDVWQQAEDAGNPKADPKQPGFAPGRALGQGQRGGGLGDQVTAPRREQPAGLGELHISIAADQQRPSDPAFHPPDPLAERRLRDVQTIRGAAEVQRFGQKEQRAEIFELDIHNHRLSNSIKRFIGQNRGAQAILVA